MLLFLAQLFLGCVFVLQDSFRPTQVAAKKSPSSVQSHSTGELIIWHALLHELLGNRRTIVNASILADLRVSLVQLVFVSARVNERALLLLKLLLLSFAYTCMAFRHVLTVWWCCVQI